MAMPRTMVVFSFVISAMLLLMSVPRLAVFLGQRSDIWWTPQALAVPLEAGEDRVQIYIGETRLRQLVESGAVLVQDGAGARPLPAGDIRLRFNTCDRGRAQRIPLLLMSAATAGVGIIFLAFGWISLFDRSRQAG